MHLPSCRHCSCRQRHNPVLLSWVADQSTPSTLHSSSQPAPTSHHLSNRWLSDRSTNFSKPWNGCNCSPMHALITFMLWGVVMLYSTHCT